MSSDNKSGIQILSVNQLKILALIAMTCDHVGKQILPQYPMLQIIGRLAFPIFAYMIAEGCRYTKNRKRYLLTMVALACLCQVVYGFAMGSLYQCILVTFSLSIVLIYTVDKAMKSRHLATWFLSGIVSLILYFISSILPNILPHTDFAIDYGFWGIVFPLIIYLAKNKGKKLLGATVGLVILSLSMGGMQWYSLCAIPILALYSGKRGKWNLKNLFYIYYPLHLVVIYLISLLF